MKVKRDQVTGLALAALGILVFVLVSRFHTPLTAEYPGPRLMPGIAAFGLTVCGLGVFIGGCRQREEEPAALTWAGLIRVLITFVILCLYILGMKYLGFTVVTPFLLYGLTTYFAKKSNADTRPVARILFAVLVTAAIWFMYVRLFDMELPAGSLFE